MPAMLVVFPMEGAPTYTAHIISQSTQRHASFKKRLFQVCQCHSQPCGNKRVNARQTLSAAGNFTKIVPQQYNSKPPPLYFSLFHPLILCRQNPESIMAGPVNETASEVLAPLVACCIAFIVLNTFFLALRYVARLWIKPVPLGADDAFIIGAYIVDIGTYTIILGILYHKHILCTCLRGTVQAHVESQGNTPADLRPTQSIEQVETQLKPALKCLYAITLLMTPGLLFPKLALLALFLRIFVGKLFRAAVWFTVAFLVVGFSIYFVVDIFACSPVHYYWDKLVDGQCINLDALYRAATGLNALYDLVILALPIFPLRHLQAPKSRKVGVMALFLTSGLGTCISIVRFTQMMKYSPTIMTASSEADLLTWIVVETSIYLIACCVAGCGSLIMKAKKLWANQFRLRMEMAPIKDLPQPTKGTSGSEHLLAQESNDNLSSLTQSYYRSPTVVAQDGIKLQELPPTVIDVEGGISKINKRNDYG